MCAKAGADGQQEGGMDHGGGEEAVATPHHGAELLVWVLGRST